MTDEALDGCGGHGAGGGAAVEAEGGEDGGATRRDGHLHDEARPVAACCGSNGMVGEADLAAAGTEDQEEQAVLPTGDNVAAAGAAASGCGAAAALPAVEAAPAAEATEDISRGKGGQNSSSCPQSERWVKVVFVVPGSGGGKQRVSCGTQTDGA